MLPSKGKINEVHKNLRFRWIQIEISSLCQASCIYCPHTSYRKFWQGRFIPEDLFSKLVKLFPCSDLIFLQGWGEPLLHPKFFDFVRMAKQCGSMVGTTTNGMLINKDLAERLVDSGIDIVSFSLTGSSYKNDLIRRGTSIDHVLKAMEWVREERERQGLSTPRIHVAYLLLKSMLPELENLPSVVADAGAEKIVISTLSLVPDPALKKEEVFTSEEKWKEESEELNTLVRKYIFKESHKWLGKVEVDIETKKVSPKRGRKKFIQCPERPVDSFFVGSDGKVSPCVFLGLPVKPPPSEIFSFDFGYLSSVPNAEKIWLRPSYQAFRENFLKGELPFPCFKCARRGTTYQKIS